jgi:hypothetical protein
MASGAGAAPGGVACEGGRVVVGVVGVGVVVGTGGATVVGVTPCGGRVVEVVEVEVVAVGVPWRMGSKERVSSFQT